MQSSGTLGYMLQGVSQQPERVQPDGHVREQINCLPDPNLGLTSRPGSFLRHTFDPVPANSFTETVRMGDDDYFIACNEGSITVYRYDGTVVTVDVDGDALDYIGTSMVAYATDNEVVLVNKNVTVEREAQTTETNVITDWGYAFHLGGLFSRTYTLTITYSDDTVATGTYTTPAGTSASHSMAVTANNIMAQLKTSLEADSNLKGTTTLEQFAELLSVRDSATTFELVADDGENNIVFRAGVSEARTFADVPKLGIEGAVLRISGELGTNTDDVWLRFDSSTTSVLGEGLGSKGTWREIADPFDRVAFDLTTMPHVLTIDGNTAELTQGNWFPRRTGNEDTSPVPSFVGSPIKDVGEFSNRLWFLAGSNFIASRTNERLDFFRASAIQIVDTDPVDIRSTGEEKTGLIYGTSYDRDLLLFSSTGQFSIAGGSAFTPGNASMVRSTNFEMSSKVRPAVAGSTVLIPYKNQLYSGVNELKPSLELDSNAVEDLSKVTKRYIRGEVIDLVASGNSGTAMMVTDEEPNRVYVYNFLWEEGRKIQSAFHKWDFAVPIVSLYIRDGEFFIWQATAEHLYLSVILPDKPEDFNLVYHSVMDFKQEVGVVDNKVTMDRPDYQFIANEDNQTYQTGITVAPNEITQVGSNWEYQFPTYVPSNLVAGVQFVCTVKPNRPIYVDWRGNKQATARVVVGKYVVDFTRSGGIEASMESLYRGDGVIATNDVFPTDDDPLTDFGQPLSNGSLDIPWGDDNFNSALVLKTNTLQPLTITEVRWWGQLFRGKK